MQIPHFFNAVTSIISQQYHDNVAEIPHSVKSFLNTFKSLATDPHQDYTIKITKITILYEAFYQFLSTSSVLKNDFLQFRQKRWENHWGTPTVPFLISFQIEIGEIIDQLRKIQLGIQETLLITWSTVQQSTFSYDEVNKVLVNTHAMPAVLIPEHEERKGEFLKTYNASGGFTTTPSDPFSQKFINYAFNDMNSGGALLEIGAAFGAASLEIIDEGRTIFCNDIEPKNLAVISNRYRRKKKNTQLSISGDNADLVLIPGSFPDDLNQLPANFFDAILICRVLHFFPGNKIEQSLELISTLLKPGGKVFLVCETPFLKNWLRFIPEYESRVEKNIKWPGEIANPAEFESSGRAASLPTFVHWLTKDILERSLKERKFEIEDIAYINRKGQFPDDLLLDGRESVGAVAIKKGNNL